MKHEKNLSRLCSQGAILRYVRVWVPLVGWRVVPVPVGQRLQPGQKAWFVLNQN